MTTNERELPESMTLYEFAKLIGVVPQSLYNLKRMGYLKTTSVEVTVTKEVITREDAIAYLEKRIAREAAKADKS
jgi:hypothetical protein